MQKYEEIKQMDKYTLTAFLFLFAQAIIKSVKGDLSKETQNNLYQSIKEELEKEVAPNGNKRSKKQP